MPIYGHELIFCCLQSEEENLRQVFAQDLEQRGEEREEAKVRIRAREVLTAVEHHVADFKAHRFDP